MESALTAGDNSSGGAKPKKSPESFLGPNSNLVNLENLVKSYHVIMPSSFSRLSSAYFSSFPFFLLDVAKPFLLYHLDPTNSSPDLFIQVPTKPTVAPAANPFALGVAGQPNPFQQQPAPRPSINELRHQQNFGVLGAPQQQQVAMNAPQQLQQLQPMTGVLQPAPAAGVWGPTPPMMQSGSGVTSPTFNPFLA